MEEATAVDSPIIKPINKSVVYRICAGQVIFDLSTAVKELVENSLDAGATRIEISLKEYGEEQFQVTDNGCGISPHNFKVLALKHHTSKLADFPDLQSLTTFGFRGEALSSLSALGNLTVETRTKSELLATHLTFDQSGLLTTEKKTARQIGTTVTVRNLFSNLPVRSKEFRRNIRKEYGKLTSLLNAYALIAEGVRFVCSNTTGKNAKSIVLSTQGKGLKDNIITVFGMSTFSCLEPVSICISDSCRIEGFLSKPGQSSGRNMGDRQYFFINGRPVDLPKVSKLVNELYKGANSRQYPIAILNFTIPTNACDVNITPDKRKVFFSDEGSILQSLREGLQQIYSSNDVSYVVNKVEGHSQDVHRTEICSPHLKSSILVRPSSPDRCDSETQMEDTPLKIIKGADNSVKDFTLRAHWVKLKSADILSGNNSRQLKTHSNTRTDQDDISSSSAAETVIAVDTDLTSRRSCVQSSLTNFVTMNKRKHEDTGTVLSELPVLRNQSRHNQLKKNCSEISPLTTRSQAKHQQIDDCAEAMEFEPFKAQRTEEVPNETTSRVSPGGSSTGRGVSGFFSCISSILGREPKDQDTVLPASESTSTASYFKNNDKVLEHHSSAALSSLSSGLLLDSPIPSSGTKIFPTLQFSLQDLRTRRQQRLSRLRSSSQTSGSIKRQNPTKCFAAATLDLSQPENEERKITALAAATTELERLFKKEDFMKMKVIGQFNLGFIIGKLEQDLFIVDQHAADEKYNFERLAQSTILNQQPLLRPQRLELSPEEEVVVSMHMDIFRKNGFLLEEDPNATPGCQYRLRAVPFSNNITFGIEDIRDLISTLSDHGGDCSIVSSYRTDTAESVCPPRVRSMLANRACRSSIMIGDPLSRKEMHKILEHLADLKSPWNCPHGRPTMRHLVDLTTLQMSPNDDNF